MSTTDVAAQYLRISEDRSDDEAGVTRQDEDTAKLIADRGWELAGTYTDNDAEASSGRARRQYSAMMAAAVRGEFSVIVVYHLSRLWRNRVERAQGIEILRRAGVSVVCVRGPEFDMSSAYSRGMAGMVGEIDTMETELKGERTRDAQLRAAAAGLHLGGRRPFGWQLVPDPDRAGRGTLAWRLAPVKPVVDEDEAAEVRKALTAVLEGRDLAAICRDLNGRGVATTPGKGGRPGKPWTPASLRAMLIRSRNYGAVKFGGEEISRTWPPIAGEDDVRKVRALLADPARRTSTGNRVTHLLAGLAVCGLCGERMKSGSARQRDGSRRRVYKCPREHLFRTMAPVDAVTEAAVIGRLSAPDARALLADDSSPAARAAAGRAQQLRDQIAEAGDMWETGEMPRAEYRERTARLRARLAAAERAMARTSRAPVLAELITAADVTAAWDALPLDRQRAVIAELITVTIEPAAGRRIRYEPGQPLDARTAGMKLEWVTPES